MGSTTVRRPRSSDRFDPRYTASTVKYPASVMAWGSFSLEKGRGGLYFLPKNKKMNADLYLEVLEKDMLKFFLIHGFEKEKNTKPGFTKRRAETSVVHQNDTKIFQKFKRFYAKTLAHGDKQQRQHD